jgi:hypothetical protein
MTQEGPLLEGINGSLESRDEAAHLRTTGPRLAPYSRLLEGETGLADRLTPVAFFDPKQNCQHITRS